MNRFMKFMFIIMIPIIYLIIYENIFLKIPEGFPGAYTIGKYSKDFCLAIIASSIFYLIYSLIPEKSREDKICIFTNKKLFQLIIFSKRMMISLVKYNDLSFSTDKFKEFSITENINLISINTLQNIAFNSIPKYYLEKSSYKDWSTYLGYFITIVKSIIDDVLKFEMYINENIIEDLLKIEFSSYYSDIDAFINKDFRRHNPTLEICHYHIEEYFKIIESLEIKVNQCNGTQRECRKSPF
jgi:hypothetical protein